MNYFKTLLVTLVCSINFQMTNAQVSIPPILELDGVLKMHRTLDTAQMDGTIMYLGYDFWGKTNDGLWRSLTSASFLNTSLNLIDDQVIIPTTPNANIIVGEYAGGSLQYGNNPFDGQRNILVGVKSGSSLTTAQDNVMIGLGAGLNHTNSDGNTILGAFAGEGVFQSTASHNNVFIGKNAGHDILDGRENTIVGTNAGYHVDSSSQLTLIGYGAGHSNTSGSYNTLVGYNSGFNITHAKRNTNLGYNSGSANQTGNDNTMLGYLAGENNQTFGNTLIGSWAGRSVSSGWNNTILGYTAKSSANGAGNVILGSRAGNTNVGSFNVIIGYDAGQSISGSNKLVIETAGFQDPDNSTPLIYGEFDNDMVQINGSMHISEFTRLKPQEAAPANPQEGTIYYDAEFKSLRVWNGIAWRELEWAN